MLPRMRGPIPAHILRRPRAEGRLRYLGSLLRDVPGVVSWVTLNADAFSRAIAAGWEACEAGRIPLEDRRSMFAVVPLSYKPSAMRTLTWLRQRNDLGALIVRYDDLAIVAMINHPPASRPVNTPRGGYLP